MTQRSLIGVLYSKFYEESFGDSENLPKPYLNPQNPTFRIKKAHFSKSKNLNNSTNINSRALQIQQNAVPFASNPTKLLFASELSNYSTFFEIQKCS